MTRYVIHNHLPAKRTVDAELNYSMAMKGWMFRYNGNNYGPFEDEEAAKRKLAGLKGSQDASPKQKPYIGKTGATWELNDMNGKVIATASSQAELKQKLDRAMVNYEDAQRGGSKDAERPELSSYMTKAFGPAWHKKGQTFPRPKPGSKEVSTAEFNKVLAEWRKAYAAAEPNRDFRGVVNKDQEERNRDRMYRDAGISRV